MDENLRRIIRNAEREPTAENYYALVIAATRAGQIVICEDTDYDYEEALFRVSIGARSGTLYVERAFAEIGSNYNRFGWRLSHFNSLIGGAKLATASWATWEKSARRKIRIHLVPIHSGIPAFETIPVCFAISALYQYIKSGPWIDPNNYS